MLATKITNVAIDDDGSFIEYLADRLSGAEDLVDYMGERGQAPSGWMGSGAAALGLHGEVDLHIIRELAAARDPLPGPNHGKELGAQRPKKWGAFEFSMSPSKDVAALWAISSEDDRKIIEECGWDATAWAVETAEGLGAALGRGSIDGQAVTHRSDGLISAVWMHGASRASDPQLHWHVFTPNRIRCSDGAWRSLYSDVLTRASRTAISSASAARLRQLLTERLGVGWERGPSGAWRIAGMPTKLTDTWSSRRRQIVADTVGAVHRHLDNIARAAAERGEPLPELSPEAAQELASAVAAEFAPDPEDLEKLTKDLATDLSPGAVVELAKSFATKLVDKRRHRKRHDEPEADRFGRWQREAREMITSIEQVLADVRDAGEAHRGLLRRWDYDTPWPPADAGGAPQPDSPQAALAQLSQDLEARTVWLYRDVAHLAAKALPAGADARWIDRLAAAALDEAREITGVEVTDPDLRATDTGAGYFDGDPTLRRWQASRVWEAERDIEDAYRDGIGVGVAVAAADEGWHTGLSEAQATEIERVCGSGDRISCIVGPAGAGKTTMMRAAAARWAQAGYAVTGLAVSAAAVSELRGAGVADSRTIASVCSPTGPQAPLGQVWIWDEAGMANTLDLARVAEMARAAGAKLLLVGDPSQLGSIGAGGMFAYLVDDLDAAEALEEVHRFRHEWEGLNSLRLRAGDPEALDTLAEHGRIAGAADIAEARAIAKAFTADTLKAGKTPLITARTRDVVHDLNQAAREALDLGPTLHRRHRSDIDAHQDFAVGDIIVTGRNATRRLRDSYGNRILNGHRWRIVGAGRRGGLRVERITDDGTPGATADLPAAYIDGSDPDGRPWIEHGIATTVHRAQGRTVDQTLAFADRRTNRSALYVALTRARSINRLVMIGAQDDAEALDAAKAAQRRLDEQHAGRAHARRTGRPTQQQPPDRPLEPPVAAGEALELVEAHEEVQRASEAHGEAEAAHRSAERSSAQQRTAEAARALAAARETLRTARNTLRDAWLRFDNIERSLKEARPEPEPPLEIEDYGIDDTLGL